MYNAGWTPRSQGLAAGRVADSVVACRFRNSWALLISNEAYKISYTGYVGCITVITNVRAFLNTTEPVAGKSLR